MARYAFVAQVIAGLNVMKIRGQMVFQYYNPGNCPEWVTFMLVCVSSHGASRFFSVCYNVRSDLIYALYQYCRELVDALGRMGVEMVDFFEHSNLGVGAVVQIRPVYGFAHHRLMDYTSIQEKFKV